MNLTKGMKCPNCGGHADFRGGRFGGGINSVNAVCDCGFKAWIIITREDHEYSVKATKINNSDERRFKYKHYNDTQLLELQIKYDIAYNLIDASIRPDMYETKLEIEEEIKDRGIKK